MRTLQELEQDLETAFEEDDWADVEDIVLEALRHLSGFAGGEYELWETSDIKEFCHDLGDEVYDKWGFSEMQAIYTTVRSVMGPVAARMLEHF